MKKFIGIMIILPAFLFSYSSQQELFPWVDSLRLRTEPNPESKTIALLYRGDLLFYSDISDKKFYSFTLRNTNFTGTFIYIKTWDGIEGWVFEPAITDYAGVNIDTTLFTREIFNDFTRINSKNIASLKYYLQKGGIVPYKFIFPFIEQIFSANLDSSILPLIFKGHMDEINWKDIQNHWDLAILNQNYFLIDLFLNQKIVKINALPIDKLIDYKKVSSDEMKFITHVIKQATSKGYKYNIDLVSEAAKDGDFEKFLYYWSIWWECFDRTLDPSNHEKFKSRILFAAVKSGNTKLVKYCIETLKFDKNSQRFFQNIFGGYPLDEALGSFGKNHPTFKYLLSIKARGAYTLNKAAYWGDIELYKNLKPVSSSDNNYIIHSAVHGNQLEMVKYLVEVEKISLTNYPYDVDGIQAGTALDEAIDNTNKIIAEYLRSKGGKTFKELHGKDWRY